MVKYDPSKLNIRLLRKEDLDDVVEIDRRVFGRKRTAYYEQKIARVLDKTHKIGISLAAEYEGKVVGFVIGELNYGEFGIPEQTATVDTIGVNPDFQRNGIGTKLMKEFIDTARYAGVRTIRTIVDWNDFGLLRFFDSVGLAPGKTINLEMKIM